MPNKTLSIEQVLSLLAETPQRISALSESLSPAQLLAAPHNEGWSANEVLAHLRSCADVWGNCMLAIIAEDTPTLRAINPLNWIKKTNYLELEFRPSLHSYTSQRAGLLAVLEALPPESWLRTAHVTGAGKPLERDVLFYGRWLAAHERQHFKQFDQIVKTLHD